MLRFAASRLCGRACDGSLAAIMAISLLLGRFHRGAGLFVMACPETGGLAEGLTSLGPPDGSARLGTARATQKKPSSGGDAGASERTIPWGKGEEYRPIRLNGAQ